MILNTTNFKILIRNRFILFFKNELFMDDLHNLLKKKFTKSDLYINRKYYNVHSDVINITSKYCDFGIKKSYARFLNLR